MYVANIVFILYINNIKLWHLFLDICSLMVIYGYLT